MRWFLDMNIILYYIGEGDSNFLVKKSKKFVEGKKDNKFLLCYYIKDWDIPKWVERQKILFRELVKQIKNRNYKPYSSKESKRLYNRDKKKILKLITLFRNTSSKKDITKKFERVFQEIGIRINIFIKENVDEFVVPIKDIERELWSSLNTYLQNISDAKTIASGIQEHNKNKKLVFITADKKDWNKENLEWAIPEGSKLKKDYPSLPEIKYLQDIK